MFRWVVPDILAFTVWFHLPSNKSILENLSLHTKSLLVTVNSLSNSSHDLYLKQAEWVENSHHKMCGFQDLTLTVSGYWTWSGKSSRCDFDVSLCRVLRQFLLLGVLRLYLTPVQIPEEWECWCYIHYYREDRCVRAFLSGCWYFEMMNDHLVFHQVWV